MLNIETKQQVNCTMHFKNIQCTIIKKGTVGVVYVEDEKRPLSVCTNNILVDAFLLNIPFPTIS